MNLLNSKPSYYEPLALLLKDAALFALLLVFAFVALTSGHDLMSGLGLLQCCFGFVFGIGLTVLKPTFFATNSVTFLFSVLVLFNPDRSSSVQIRDPLII